MTLSVKEKAQIINKYKQAGDDTSSPGVQVALLFASINKLQGHLKANGKNHHSRYGLTRMVNQRRKLLDHLKGRDVFRYTTLIGRLGLCRQVAPVSSLKQGAGGLASIPTHGAGIGVGPPTSCFLGIDPGPTLGIPPTSPEATQKVKTP